MVNVSKDILWDVELSLKLPPLLPFWKIILFFENKQPRHLRGGVVKNYFLAIKVWSDTEANLAQQVEDDFQGFEPNFS